MAGEQVTGHIGLCGLGELADEICTIILKEALLFRRVL